MALTAVVLSLLLCLIASCWASVTIDSSTFSGSRITIVGLNSQSITINNSTLTATSGSDTGILLQRFGTGAITASTLSSAQRVRIEHLFNLTTTNSNISSGVGCNTDNSFEANIQYPYLRYWASSGNTFTSGQSIIVSYDRRSQDINDFDHVRSLASTNDRFVLVQCYSPDGIAAGMQGNPFTHKPSVYFMMRQPKVTSSYTITLGVMTNPTFTGNWYSVNFRFMQVDGQNNQNFQTTNAAIWLVRSTLSNSVMQYRRLRLIGTELVSVTATSFRRNTVFNGGIQRYTDADVRVFGPSDSGFTNVRLLDLHRGIRVTKSSYYDTDQARLFHRAGVDEFQFGPNAVNGAGRLVASPMSIDKVKVSGPQFQYGERRGAFRMTSSTIRFQCYDSGADDGSSGYYNNGDRAPHLSDTTVINTPSADNCVDVTVRSGYSVEFSCRTNNLYFHVNGECWSVFEGYTLDDSGPHLCRASSTLQLASDRTVLNGVSFASVHTYVLTQVFRRFVDGDEFDVSSRVKVQDFQVRNGRVLRVEELSGSGSTADGVITHLYRVTVESTCDGTVETRYMGTIDRLRSTAQIPNRGSSEYCNRGGQYKSARSIVYAGCLANQFCI